MNKRKRIALLSSQLEERYQKEFLEGFLESAFAKDYDVCVFSTFKKEPESQLKEVGETNIFSLINYDLFDAVVVQPDILQISGLMMRIEKDLAEKFKGTVLYVDRESSIYPYVMLNHYKPIYKVISHLIEDHGCKDIAFLAGYKWHSHSKERLSSFLDCMDDHGLKVGDNRIFYGNFWYDSGISTATELINSGAKLPEALVCANDYMAMGAAETFVKHGINIPEDIAIVGYDSVESGQNAPTPITSVPLPTKPFGGYVAAYLDSLINNTTPPKFDVVSDIFYGSSCGCHSESLNPLFHLRNKWDSQNAIRGYFASFNRLTEDLVLQSTFEGLIDAIQTYSYQIREFDSFTLCLNDVWALDRPVTDAEIRNEYTDKIIPILQCGRSGEGADRVTFDERFDKKDLIPKLHEDSDVPRAFIFSPVFFDDISFGYAVLSYGNEIRSYSEAYYLWMRSIMTGIENYRRSATLQLAKKAAEDTSIHDQLTGMFNYAGFVKHARPMIERGLSTTDNIAILAMDLASLDSINTKHGRSEGDNAIRTLASIILECSDEGTMCCRLGNDEFILASLCSVDDSDYIYKIQRRISKALSDRNSGDVLYNLHIFSGASVSRVNSLAQMEDLVNSAVSQKNGNKAIEQSIMNSSNFTEEDLIKAELVKKILDENLFKYHFQPIVSAVDGSIFAYEALMRANTPTFVSPLEILKFAKHLDRLVDVQRATFINVLNYVHDQSELFDERKVFLNSIPNVHLQGEASHTVLSLLQMHNSSVVVELTEQAEADDDELTSMKNDFERIGIETAVDDYGTGYSNIVNLLRYMPNYVKIDRMLLSEIQNNPQKQHFVKDIVLFAHDNHFKVLAEGIETSEELRTVIRLGVDLIQGYYTARPNPEVIPCIPEEIQTEIQTFYAEFNK